MDIVLKNVSPELIETFKGMGLEIVSVDSLPTQTIEVIKEVPAEIPEHVSEILAIINKAVEDAAIKIEKKYEIYKTGYEAVEKVLASLKEPVGIPEIKE